MTAPIEPTPIDLLPVGPRPIDTVEQFNAKSFATIEAQEAMVPQINAATAATYQNAVAANERAVIAGDAAAAAAGSAGTANNQANRSRDEADRSEAAKQAAMAVAAAIGEDAGLPSMAGKAGQALVVLPDETGVGWAVVNARGTQEYTASQSINKSIFGTATYVLVELWGGGASGNANAASSGTPNAPGGEGGSYEPQVLLVASLATTTTLTIGAGGAAVSATSSGAAVRGNAGGNSSFAGVLALGGLSSPDPNSATYAPANGTRGANGGIGGGEGNFAANANPNTRIMGGPGGSSVKGGGGGGCGAENNLAPWRAAGTSVLAGSGGAGLSPTVTGQIAGSGVAPSGGGGGIRLTASAGNSCTSGAGARGQARLTWW